MQLKTGKQFQKRKWNLKIETTIIIITKRTN